MFQPVRSDRTAPASAEAPALRALILALKQADYHFVTPTPATHARVVARRRGPGTTLADIFGWSRPFEPAALDPALLECLAAGGLVVRRADGLLAARARVSSLGPDLFVHSAYPTDAADAVFFGPDSYRFATLVAEELRQCPQRPGRLLDLGAGVGAIVAGRACPDMALVMLDINPRALAFARCNAAAAGVEASFVQGGDLALVPGPLDVILANPPFIVDDTARQYRHGGGLHGAQVALDMAQAATARLGEGGRLILYTGSAIVAGADGLRERLATLASARGYRLDYREIDPDIFGEELERPAYADVDRIALVAAVLRRA